MTTGDTEGAFQRLRRAAASGEGQTGGHLELANLLLAAVSADPRFGSSEDEPFEHLAEGIRVAAQSGDAFAYQLFILASASAYQARGRPADAVATVTNGYASLESAASGLGAALAAWMRAMEDEMGTGAFEQAHGQALSLIEADKRRLQAA